MHARSTAVLLALALPCGCTSPSANTSEGDASSTAIADDSTVSATAGSSDTSGPTSSMTGNTMTTTAGSSSTGPQGCAGDDACGEPGTPICIDEVCSPCESSAQCAAKDPANPACRDDGQCVQCTASNDHWCAGATPACDAALNTCVGCSFHGQCPDSACRIATGECFDEADLHTVGPGMDFDNFTQAAAALGSDSAMFLVSPGTSFNEIVTLSGPEAVWGLFGITQGGTAVPQWINTTLDAPTISIEDGAELYVDSIRIRANASYTFPGIAVDNASLYLGATFVVGNLGGGISLANGSYGLVVNSLVEGGTATSSDAPAIDVQSSDLAFLYTTIVGRDDGFGGGTGVRCAASTVTGRNSFVVKLGSGAEIECAAADVSYSATESMTDGAGNVTLGPIMQGWLDTDLNLNAPPAALLTAARWQSGDPPRDIDGDDRPGVDGSADVAGADIP